MNGKKKILVFHEIGYKINPWVVTPEEFRKALVMNPDAEIHFDDGRLGAYVFGVKILEEFKRKATYFIVPNWILGREIPWRENYSRFIALTDLEMIKNIGHKIGSHSMSHRNLKDLNDEELLSELLASKQFLESNLGIRIDDFSYPFGTVDEKIKKEAEKIYRNCYSLQSPLGIKREIYTK